MPSLKGGVNHPGYRHVPARLRALLVLLVLLLAAGPLGAGAAAASQSAAVMPSR